MIPCPTAHLLSSFKENSGVSGALEEFSIKEESGEKEDGR
jgi:hypothetical protein